MRIYGNRNGSRGLGLFAIALTAAIAVTSASAQNNPGKVTIGVLTELSGGGAVVGAAVSAGLRLAVKEINEKGGILGKPVELILSDSQTDPAVAVNEALRLTTVAKVDAIIGPSFSQLVLAVIPVLNRSKTFQVHTGGASTLTPEVGPYQFSMGSNTEAQSIAMINYAVDVLKAKSAAILIDNGGQSKDAARVLKEQMPKHGLVIAGEQEYSFRTDDMTPQLLSLKRNNPDLILFSSSNPEDVAKLLQNLEEIRWPVRVAGGVSVPTYAAAVVKIVGRAAFERTTGLGYSGLVYCGKDPVGTSEYSKYLQRLKASTPEYDKLMHYTSVYSYDAMYVVKQAMEGAGTTDGAQVAAWVEQNSAKMRTITASSLAANKQTHFLVDAKNVVPVDQPYLIREDGLQRRAGC